MTTGAREHEPGIARTGDDAHGIPPHGMPTVPFHTSTPHAPPRLSLVVPTRNEESTIGDLLQQLQICGLAALDVEVIVVDDSDDETPVIVNGAIGTCAFPLTLVHRPPGSRGGGLSGAVVAGAGRARGEWVMVMDADLQHPPADAVRLARAALAQGTDVVVGTRYAGGGSSSGLEGGFRSAVSSGATAMARVAFPRRLATISDPMSGLFAWRRAAVDLDGLHASGFKLLLEILVRNPAARVAEVAYSFAPRASGTSKAGFSEGITFIRHLSRLRRDVLVGQLRSRPRKPAERRMQAARALAFGLVGLSGLVVNSLVLYLVHHRAGFTPVLSAAVATQASTAWNFALVDLFVYRNAGTGTRRGRAVRFFVMNNVLLLFRLPVFVLLVATGVGVITANVVTLVALFALRFLVSDRVIYNLTGAATAGGPPAQDGGRGTSRDPVRILVDRHQEPAAGGRRRSQYLAYRYDIAGIVTIGSQIKLPELEFFRAQWVADADVDIAVRTGDVGSRIPRARAQFTHMVQEKNADGARVTLRYEEQLGGFGANFLVELGETITVTVGPLLARSPHVVYTNIIEALLRFVMVDRGHMLLHSATITLDGVGVMLSALTDTGKTATILRLLREHGGRFLSDDMTIVRPDGTAVCFPKPLTISAHTVRAVHADNLSKREWRRLQWQSRLHSKGGRSIALTLSRFNLPIMGINAITQILVPPPKYSVDRLVGCRMGSSAGVKELFVIERGAPRLEELDSEETLDRMLTNTDDAYGFPPFKYLAPGVRINGLDYRALRDRERETLRGFLSHVRARVLASDDFGWADEIPRLLHSETLALIDGREEWPRWRSSPTPVAGS
jgi:dolichol-phosphate mannosyltransferase